MESKLRSSIAILAALAVCACGSDSKSDDSPDPGGDGLRIPVECRGFSLDGIQYSPGGTTLPNTCEPFHTFTNNPYAVRCVDALPEYETPYAGDEYCILPPPPELGMQVGVHPQKESYWDEIWAGDLSGYSDSSRTGEYELEPGGETEQTYDITTPNDTEHFFYRINSRMRTGSHHLASFFTQAPLEEKWVDGPAQPGGFSPADFATIGQGDPSDIVARGAFFNVQRAATDRPQGSLELPEEDRVLGMPLAAHQGIHFDLHHFNTSGANILREVWINVWWTDDATARGREFAGVADVDVAPGETKELSTFMTATGETRILSLFGHRHAWTPSVKAWIQRTDGSIEPVYETHDWLEVPTLSYDSLTQNPALVAGGTRDGGHSGVLMMHAGDELHFTCRVEATAERAAEVSAPLPTEPLRFGNHVFTAEMCILYGSLTGPSLTGAVMLN